MEEIWKEIEGWSGKYLISSHGRFKSIGGKYKFKHPEGYITHGNKQTIGYMAVTLRRPGVCQVERIHALVAKHFLIRPPEAECVNHKNGIKTDNRVENLEWTTLGENVRHAVRTGLMDLKGEKHPHAKLNRTQIVEIRRLSKIGINHHRLGEWYKVNRRHIGDIVRGVNWGWLKDEL